MKHMREDGNGLFIAIEGTDGSGQTTQANKLVEYLREKGFQANQEKEPTNNLVGGLIRGQLTHEWSSTQECLQLLFAADRSHHLEKDIFPALNNDHIVVTDRYFYSSMAFGQLDLPLEWIEKINERFPAPDIAFYLDVSVEESLNRMEERPSAELFEKKKKMRRIRQNYLDLVDKREELHRIDGEKDIESVHKEIKDKVDKYIEETYN